MKKALNKHTYTHTLTDTYVLTYIHINTNPSVWAGCDTRSILKRSITEFPFSQEIIKSLVFFIDMFLFLDNSVFIEKEDFSDLK